jgi:hypothetical protein
MPCAGIPLSPAGGEGNFLHGNIQELLKIIMLSKPFLALKAHFCVVLSAIVRRQNIRCALSNWHALINETDA